MTGCSSGAFRLSRVEHRRTLVITCDDQDAAAHSCAAGRSSHSPVTTAPPADRGESSVVHDREAPGPAGELAGHRDGTDRGAFPTRIQPRPASVQAPVAVLGAVADRGWLAVAAADQLPAGPIGLAVMPRRLHQQPPGVAVAGLGDPTLRPPGATRGLRGHQTHVGTDRGAGEPVPVPDLDRRFEGATTSHRTPAAVSARARPNPVGPAS
jgi:hypothetical protein